MRILDTTWRSAKDTIGIVLIENDAGEQSARIGPVMTIGEGTVKIRLNLTEVQDSQYIADHGAKLSFKEAQAFFPWIKEENYKK